MMCFAKNVFEQERGFKQYHELILSTILNLCQPLYNSRSKSLSMILNTANIFHKEIYSIWLDIKGYNYSLCLTFCLYRVKKWCCRKIWHSLTDQIRVVMFAHVERFKNDPFPNFSFQALWHSRFSMNIDDSLKLSNIRYLLRRIYVNRSYLVTDSQPVLNNEVITVFKSHCLC